MTLRRIVLSLALLVAGFPTAAEVARVKGGEHPEFTRIVIEAEGEDAWLFGRTEDGYELALSERITAYDLSVAFDKIPKDRVSGLWRDPGSGRLRIALSCACHAIAFEFRPGIIVVDVKTGAPPAGSSFEQALPSPELRNIEGAEGPDTAAVEGVEAAAPEPAGQKTLTGGYDWLAIAMGEDQDATPGRGPDLGAMEVAAGLAPLQEALLQQISRGAAEGIVQIAEHPVLPDAASGGLAEADGMRVAVGELPGLVIGPPREPDEALASDGTQCIPDDKLAIQEWGLPGGGAEQLGPGRSGLLTEFDAPVPDAILRAAKTYIALGFGAEARQFLDLLDNPSDADVRLLRSMAHIVDQEPPLDNVFVGMESCNGAAALWATLAAVTSGPEALAALHDLRSDAVARAFSALAVHQRRHLGPGLVEAFLALGDEEGARRLRDAIHRAPGEAGTAVDLMEARYDLATGNAEAAEEAAAEVKAEGGPLTGDAAVTQVEAAFSAGTSVPAELPLELAALLKEAQGTQLEAPLRRALVLGSALAGDIEGAFVALAEAPDAVGDLWSIAASAAPDSLFFERAVAAARAPAEDRPSVASATAFRIAERLMTLGFAAEALTWLGPTDTMQEAPRRMLAARAHLALRDARGAIEALSGLGDPEAELLRAEAMLQLGDPAAAAEAYERAGDAAAQNRAEVWLRDWARLAEEGADPWAAAAALLEAPDRNGNPADSGDSAPGLAEGAPPEDVETPAAGPLAEGTALIEESARARSVIEGLLLSTAVSGGS